MRPADAPEGDTKRKRLTNQNIEMILENDIGGVVIQRGLVSDTMSSHVYDVSS